jgi:hypothetical protein
MEPAFSYGDLKIEINQAEGETEHLDAPTPEAKNQFALELDYMADCVLNNRKPYTPSEEGLED